MQFDDFADSYNDHAFIQNDLIEWGLPWLNIVPITNSSILEFGAGTGLLTKQLTKKKPSQITATDISLSMILNGKKHSPEAFWEVRNAWDSSHQLFDHIFSSGLLQWCPNPQTTISNWAQQLSSGGTIHSLFFIDQTLKELRKLIPFKPTIEWRTLKSWESFFKNAGLQILLSREFTKAYDFSSALHLLKTLKYTGTSLKNQLRVQCLKQILKDYDKQYRSNKGVTSTWQFCQLVIKK